MHAFTWSSSLVHREWFFSSVGVWVLEFKVVVLLRLAGFLAQ